MLVKNHKYKKCRCLLWLGLLLAQFFWVANADVIVQSVIQSPGNPVVEGTPITYTVTVFNPDETAVINIVIRSGESSVSSSFLTSDGGCLLNGNGIFDCAGLPSGDIATYRFVADDNQPFSFPDSIEVACDVGPSVACAGERVFLSSVTEIIPAELSPAELGVARSLDATCLELSGSNSRTKAQDNLLAICTQLDSTDPATKLLALQQITPTQIPAQTDLSFRSSNTQLNNVNTRMTELRSGTSVNSLAGLNLQYAGLTLPAELFLANQNHLTLGLDTDAEIQRFVPKMGMFVSGNVSFGEKEDVVDELGFDFNTAGMTVGIDYRLSHAQIVGGAVGVVNSDSDFNGSRGNTDIRGLSLLAYSTYYLNQSSYLEAVLSFGKNKFDNSRNIVAGPINALVSGETDGTEASISLGVGHDFSQGSYSFSPYGKINYIRTDIDGYSENSNTGLELTYDDQAAKSLSVNVGGQFSYAISQKYGVILPTLRFDWMHEYKDDSRFITASFLNDPTGGKFDIKTAVPDTDYFKLGIGVSATFQGGRSAFIFYESLLAQNNVTQESVSGGFRWVF